MNFKCYVAAVCCFALLMVSTGGAVTSVITRHNTSADFLKGDVDGTVIDSTGKIHLAPQTTPIETGDLLNDVWSIHTMIADADAVYLGTGPDAAVFRYADGKVDKIYPTETFVPVTGASIRNQHVFAMAKDLAGRLLIGVSGEKGQLIRLAKTPEVVFEDEKVQYIYAIAQDEENNVYLATGPNGRIYRLNAFCQNPEVIYEAKDKNILSLLVKDGVVYAGGDERGLVYKIDPVAKSASVLYDADQNEVVSLLMDKDGNLYAAATSAAAAMLQLKASVNASMKSAPGRPDTDDGDEGDDGDGESTSNSTAALNTANGDESSEQKQEASPERKAPTPPTARLAGRIYRISPEGFVTDLFAEIAVFYAMLEFEDKLWLGTGGKAELYTVNPATEEKSVFYADKTSSQITSLLAVDDVLYLGLSNPARLLQLKKQFVASGVYTSELVDAAQPAQWGKLQIEATIPDGTEILMASRSGNVKEPNDPTFSDWTPDTVITQPTDLKCPLGRYCQYRLTLKTSNPSVSPVIREAAVASVIPNLSPKVNAVRIQRSRDKNKPTIYEIAISASDENKDTLEYALEFRKMGRSVWIPLKDELDAPRYEWDSRTVEDGRYEVRVTANDRKSNTVATTLTGSRVSDPVVLDNTAPVITESAVNINGNSVELTLSVEDAFTVIGKVQYTVNSNEQWMGTLPVDRVYDTRTEDFVILIDDLKPGVHVIAVSVSDDLENTRYKTFEVTIP